MQNQSYISGSKISEPAFRNETGDLPVPLTNDYLFRALLQSNEHVLKGLTASLLHLTQEEIQSLEITNPIILGDAIDNKTFILDICVELNDNTTINLEMQVINEHNWADRSLSYLCRKFDHLCKGENYTQTKNVYQIGLLDFTLFEEYPEFYARYELLNIKSYYKYSDKFHLHVLDLTRIDLATEEDKQYQIDLWADLFKAKTWEDLKKMSQNDEMLQEVLTSLHTLLQDENIREQCRAREEYYYREKHHMEALQKVEELTSDVKLLTAVKNQLTADNNQLTADNNQLTADNNQLTADNNQLAADNQKLTADINQLTEKNQFFQDEIKRLKALLEHNSD